MMNYKAVLFLILIFPPTALPTNSWLEINFESTQYSALVENITINESEFNDLNALSYGFFEYFAKIKIIESYYGNLKAGDEREIYLYIPAMAKSRHLDNMKNPYLISFCQSKNGLFYLHRDYVIQPGTEEYITEYRRLLNRKSIDIGKHDCKDTNYKDLNPDNHK